MNIRKSLSHEQAAELLPWLVNDSIDGEEREHVLEHALDCVICRRELEHLERLGDTITGAAESMPIPAPDMRKVNARIDALINRQILRREWVSRLRDLFLSPWRVAFAAQTVLIMVLATVLVWRGPGEPEFTTLTQPQDYPQGHYLRVVFSPDLDASKISSLLEKNALTVADGPSERGVFTLGMSEGAAEDDRARLLEDLQADPDVLFAQPVVTGENR